MVNLNQLSFEQYVALHSLSILLCHQPAVSKMNNVLIMLIKCNGDAGYQIFARIFMVCHCFSLVFSIINHMTSWLY